MLIDEIVRDLKAKGINVDNHNPIVELPLRRDFRFSLQYGRKCRKKYSKPLAKI